MNYQQAVDYLLSFPDIERSTLGARGPMMSLESMKLLLAHMDNPQQGRHTIHVTGSKGKGSTSAMIAQILHEAGFETAAFSSPHLHSFTERIKFRQEPVAEARFASGVSEIRDIIQEEMNNGAGPFSTFGLLTALFFQLVRKSDPPIEWQIVEVGLGGRYDATNVFETKDAAVITAISLEHTEILGNSQSEIALNKAGIITPGCFTVLAPQKDPAVRSAVARRCHHVGAALIDVKHSCKIKPLSRTLSGQSFSLESGRGSLTLATPMLAVHQVENAATAAVVAQALKERGADISDDSIVNGIKKATLAARFEVMQATRSPGVKIIIDGAHNHESAASLVQSLKTYFGKTNYIFVVGISTDKNMNAIWRELGQIATVLIATRSKSPRAMEPTAIEAAVHMQSTAEIAIAGSIAEALDKAQAMAKDGDVICVTGSLFVAAEARECLLVSAAL